MGKRSVFHRVIKDNPLLRECSEIFCTAGKDLHSIEDHGCRLMVSLFNGTQSDSLKSLRHSVLSKKQPLQKGYVKPETLPPTTSAAKFYLQVMQWMSKSEALNSTEWGWDVQRGKLVPLMMDLNPAPDKLLKMIHCKCSTGCFTRKCSCRRNGLECTTTCGHFCENMAHEPVIEDEER